MGFENNFLQSQDKQFLNSLGQRQQRAETAYLHFTTDPIVLTEFLGLEGPRPHCPPIVQTGNPEPRVSYSCKVTRLAMNVGTLEWG